MGLPWYCVTTTFSMSSSFCPDDLLRPIGRVRRIERVDAPAEPAQSRGRCATGLPRVSRSPPIFAFDLEMASLDPVAGSGCNATFPVEVNQDLYRFTVPPKLVTLITPGTVLELPLQHPILHGLGSLV